MKWILAIILGVSFGALSVAIYVKYFETGSARFDTTAIMEEPQ